MEEALITPIPQPAQNGATPLVVVTFELDAQQYGLPLEVVREIVRLPAMIGLAGTSPALCGLLNLRGYYLPVLDGRVLIGAAPHCDLNSQVMVIGHSRPKLGLLVDRVDEVATFAPSSRLPLPPGMAAPLLDSLIKGQPGTTILLDVGMLAGLAAAGQQAAVEQAVATLVERE